MVARAMRKPPWLRVRLPGGPEYAAVRAEIERGGLATVCDEARCPNRGECFGRRTATFMVLGRQCTRSCRFCSVETGGRLRPADAREPERVARAAAHLGLRFVVLTMVTRDDLEDGGAAHLVACVEALRRLEPPPGVELLVSDLGGAPLALELVAGSGAQVLAHNLEVVRRLTGPVRDPRADYDRSLCVLQTLRRLAPPEVPTKSSLLLGLGEREDEVLDAFDDLRAAGVTHLTLGQYLQPLPGCWPVAEYVHPDRFARYEELARARGFESVFAGPLVRSSYRAEEHAGRAPEPDPRSGEPGHG